MAKAKKNSDYNSIFATRLRDLISEHETTITEVANNINVTRQAVSAYQDGSSQPTADTLLKIANYFNVSTDYLLGKSDVQTSDTTIKDICEYTGLSEKALHKIKSWNETDDFQQFFSKILSDIIEAEEAQNLFCYTSRYLSSSRWEGVFINDSDAKATIDMIDQEAASLWYAQKEFVDILETIGIDERIKAFKDSETNGNDK